MLRKRFELEHDKMFPIMEFLELIMPKIDPEFVVVPVEDSDLPGRAAETIPELHMIRVKQSIYDAACAGGYWARLVMAHELGHYLCHGDDNVAYAYPVSGEQLPPDIDAERQADIFAAELLVPVNLIDEPSEFLVSKHFGVPKGVARTQIGQAKRVQKRHQYRAKKRRSKENG